MPASVTYRNGLLSRRQQYLPVRQLGGPLPAAFRPGPSPAGRSTGRNPWRMAIAVAASAMAILAFLAVAALPAQPATGKGILTNNYSIQVGQYRRSYQVLSPADAGRRRLPVIVYLHGSGASIGLEEGRDGLLPLVALDEVVLVYPTSVYKTWNAGACCRRAMTHKIQDAMFISDVLDRIRSDPLINPNLIFLAGYSNGGKMAYRVACLYPGKISGGLIVLAGAPMAACPPGRPLPLLQIDGTNDPDIPYSTASPPVVQNGYNVPPVLTQVANWRSRDGCSSASTTSQVDDLTVQTWSDCEDSTVVDLATYKDARHGVEIGEPGSPPSSDLLYGFIQEIAGRQAEAAARERAAAREHQSSQHGSSQHGSSQHGSSQHGRAGQKGQARAS